jgi:putative glutamine amidotransferase
MSTPAVPCVWVVASHRELNNEHGQPQCYTLLDEAGTRTLANLGLQPVCYPRVPVECIESLLGAIDGLLLGGSATNVQPHLFGEKPISNELVYDTCRDAVAQPLLRAAVQRRIPIIAFCRGSHDLNVAFGGSLHQSLKDLPGSLKHWEDDDETVDENYVERHAVTCVAGGELERITHVRRFPASSLHSQGVKQLGRGLVAEAHADDGLIEAFRWHDASLFAWGFQFHPEWGWRWHPCYGRIMRAFAGACEARFSERQGSLAPPGRSPHHAHPA